MELDVYESWQMNAASIRVVINYLVCMQETRIYIKTLLEVNKETTKAQFITQLNLSLSISAAQSDTSVSLTLSHSVTQ